MKLQGSGNTAVLTGGLTAPVGSFSINATAKAFAILSSGLYTDKILAVIRELSCNAYDAHVAAGCADKPFDIHLPNQFEPYFRVSDQGPGLAEEDVYGLYTTYFASSKTDSNEYIGALGLGSKSPFSYSDTFTVTSRHGGTRKVYTAYLTEDGMPSIVKMSEEPHTGPTGIDVQLAVKSHDFYTFQDRARSVFVYFPVHPVIQGAKIQIQVPEYTTKGTGWAIRKDGFGDGGTRAIQGVVSYPVPQTNDPKADELLRLGVDMFFEIGELEVAASREALSMTKATAKNLAERVKTVAAEIGAEVSKSIENAPTYWEAVKLYLEVMRNPSIRYAVKNVDIKWQGRKLEDYFDIKPHDHPLLSLYCLERRGYGRAMTKDAGNKYISPREHTLVRNDLTKGSKGVLTRWAKQFGEAGRKYYLVSPGFGISLDTANPAMDEFFADTLGGVSDIKLLSELKAQLPKLVRVNGAARNVFQVFTHESKWRDSWEEAKDDDLEAEEFFYVRTWKGQPGLKDDESCIEDLLHGTSSLNSIKLRLVRLGRMTSDDPIFSGSPRLMQELNRMDADERVKWVNIMDVALEAIEMTPEEKTELASIHNVLLHNAGLRSPNRTLEATLAGFGITEANRDIPALQDIIDAYTMHFKAAEVTLKYQDRIELASLLGRTITGLTSKTPELSNLRVWLKRFNLLQNGFNQYSDSKTSTQAVEIITLLHETGKI